ncbi:chromosome segregation protein SMC [Corynebacterium choanae]|uniref:Chromosome partition protein Smc n=1 Tax=Corynebacterium choanae TaxID=1862358 RepID=A0A3G6JAG0_9CORY|nr:chromosome segregation protein SMC [Corynebacterium choanae]AZA13898.1 Chromosome partition protein Smc [Corynebacterium choanae]
MHLKSLTLKGFKSFASATTLKFEPGICCVVGPNGSGKSNVVDALAWVMGEQGAKNLRGGKMDDVIFAGAGSRAALGRAEVTLTIDNRDQALPIEFAEVSITRRMFRDGASEYEINGQKARLMDVQELLSDSGIGREMHVIVGQGRLAEILQSRPEERRAFIEEAAGVLKHKRRKEKAQRKLVNMQANVDRLQDLTDELGKQLKPLARQAKAAQRAATVQATVRQARQRLAAFDYMTRETAVNKLQAEAQQAGQARDAAAARVAQAQDALTAAEQQVTQLSPATEEADKLFFDLSSLKETVAATRRIAADRAQQQVTEPNFAGEDPQELRRRAAAATSQLAALEEQREEAQERRETIAEQLDDAQQQLRAAEAEVAKRMRAIADKREGLVRLLAREETVNQQLARLRDDAATFDETVRALEDKVRLSQRELLLAKENLHASNAARSPLVEAVDTAAAEATAAETRLDTLRKQVSELEKQLATRHGMISTLQATLPVGDDTEFAKLTAHLTSLAQHLTVAPAYAPAVAAALGGHAQGLVGDITVDAITELDPAGITRTTVVQQKTDDRQHAAQPQPGWRLDITLPAGCRWILDVIECEPSIAPIINRLLADVVVVDNPAAIGEIVQFDQRLRVVDQSGTLAGYGWVEIGRKHSNPVEVASKISTAEAEAAAYAEELQVVEGTLDGATKAAATARVTLARAQAALAEHDAAHTAVAKDVDRAETQVAATTAEAAKAATRYADTETQLAALQEEYDDLVDRLALAEDPQELAEPDTAERDAAQQAVAQLSAMEVEARLALRTVEERVESLTGKPESLLRRAEAETQARARAAAAAEQARAKQTLARAIADHASALFARLEVACEVALAKKREAKTSLDAATTARSQAASHVRTSQQQLDSSTEQAHAIGVQLARAEELLEQAASHITSQLATDPASLVAELGIGDDFDREAEQQQLAQAQRDLTALGKVNPLALEEYKALEERHSYLVKELDDIERARADLRQVIAEVDDKILTLFTDAWRDVEAHFPQVFATLFPGGTGRLVLTDPNDMLTTGIEVEARPPGKKVTRLTLLSGGEKSLTTLALLVAIFKARPSPFYVLDEVEAALDDVNLRRLIALLKQLRHDSQLIIITHQKPTMEIANVLYGVTMRGDGVTRVISQRMTPFHDEPEELVEAPAPPGEPTP